MKSTRIAALLALCLLAGSASAATCMNKFVKRTEAPRQIVTLLTGKLTYPEAQALAGSRRRDWIEWVDDKGKSIAKAMDLRVVRPMPVGCDGKTSGVVVIATFLTAHAPSGTMWVRVDTSEPVAFTEQKE